MTAEAIIAISAAVVACVQLVKWTGLPDQRGPIAVLVFSFLGVGFWGWSHGVLTRAEAFNFFVGWVAVATSAAGVFGFTRSGPSALTATKTPPAAPGAGASKTEEKEEGADVGGA